MSRDLVLRQFYFRVPNFCNFFVDTAFFMCTIRRNTQEPGIPQFLSLRSPVLFFYALRTFAGDFD